MKTREEALTYGLSFPDTYQDAPFRDANWQLVRVKKSKKVFLWTYEREGLLCLNVKVTPESRDFWRGIYDSVVPGWHQNKEHWNTIVLDGTIPDADVRKMIYESYELVTDNPTKRIYEAVWHEKANGYFHAVENTIFQIRKKIKKYSSDKNYIKTVVGYGYKFEV